MSELATWGIILGIVLVGGVTISHALGWVAGFIVDPQRHRENAMFRFGRSETTGLGCVVFVGICFGLTILYGLVRFIKWAWSD